MRPVRHHDLGVIPFSGHFDAGFIHGIQVARRQMRAEEIAGEHDPVFFQIGAHGFGPVNPGQENELQRLVAQRDPFPILYLNERTFIERHHIGHHPPTPRIRDDLGIGE